MKYFQCYKDEKTALRVMEYLNDTFTVFDYAKLEYQYVENPENLGCYTEHCLMMHERSADYHKAINDARLASRDFLAGYQKCLDNIG